MFNYNIGHIFLIYLFPQNNSWKSYYFFYFFWDDVDYVSI